MVNETKHRGFLRQLRGLPRLPAPPVLAGMTVVFVAVTGFLLFLYTIGGDVPQRFFREGMAVDAMSTVFLAMAAGFAWACMLIYPGRREFGSLLWLCFGAGLMFLALDEQLQIHETVGRSLKEPLGASSTFRNWNDMLVIVYGVVALGVAGMFLKEIVRYPRLLLLLGIGFFFYLAHTALDSVLETSGTKTIMEESCKLYSTGFFMLAMLAALRSMVLARDEALCAAASRETRRSSEREERRAPKVTGEVLREPRGKIIKPPPAA